MTIKTIFLDRDGVINKEKNYLYKIKDFEFIEGIFDACLYFQSLDFKIVVVTNQSGISRGLYSEKDFVKISCWMIEEFKKRGISILDLYHCPHLPNSSCDCRKPKPGMFLKAKNKYNIEMSSSWMIGDTEEDIYAANLAGIENTILVRTGHPLDESKSNAKFFLNSIKESIGIVN